MPFLDKIVEQLNENWIKSSLKFIPAGKIKTAGIVETIVDVRNEGDEDQPSQKIIRFPGLMDDDGDARMVDLDDSFHLVAYHRLENVQNSQDQKTGFGDDVGKMVEVANMALIVFAFRSKVRKTPSWLEGLLKDSIPATVQMKDTSGNVLQTSTLKIGNSSFDKLALLQREFSEVELSHMNLIVFETKYRIESTWKKGCFNKNCGC